MVYHSKDLEKLPHFTFYDFYPNIFLITFESMEDKNWVQNGRPWLFNFHLLFLKVFDGHTPPSRMDFTKEAFWVLMHDLPLACMNEKFGFQIGNTIGSIQMCDVNQDGIAWGMYLHIFIELDITKPIVRGSTLNVKQIQSNLNQSKGKHWNLLFKQNGYYTSQGKK